MGRPRKWATQAERQAAYEERKRSKKASNAPIEQAPGRDPLEFLLDVMQGLVLPTGNQLDAARAALPYIHAKKGEGGKKGEQADAARKVAAGNRFSPLEAPRLAARDGKAV